MKRVKVNFNFKSLALALFALVLSSNVWGDDRVIFFNETFGTPTGNTNVTAYEGWSETGVTYSGDAKVGITNSNQCGLSGSSGGGYMYESSSSIKEFVVSGINTSGYTNIKLSINRKGGSTSSRFTISYSTNGTSYTELYSNSSCTTGYVNVAPEGNLPSSENLYIKILNTATNYGLFFDDLILTGEATGPSCTTPPTVSAGAASDATTSSLTFNCAGGITSLGSTGCSITEYGYVYGTSSNPTTSDTKHKVGESYTTTGTAFAEYTATGLNCGTTYYMRPYAINGNDIAYGAQAPLATLDCPVDHFIDNIQETSGYTGDGKAVSTSYTKVSITLYDKAAATSGNCEEIHYHFVGWVTAADRSAGNVDAEHIVNFQAFDNTPTGATYYAVWAAEQE